MKKTNACAICTIENCNPYECDKFLSNVSEEIKNSLIKCKECEHGAVSKFGKGFCFIDIKHVKEVQADDTCKKAVRKIIRPRRITKKTFHTTKEKNRLYGKRKI